MKGRFLQLLFYGMPALVILLSLLAMNSGPLLKRPASPAEDLPALVAEIGSLSTAGRWAEAAEVAGLADKAWDRVRGRVAFTTGPEDLRRFDLGLAELRGALEAKDEKQVRLIHRRLMVIWTEIGR